MERFENVVKKQYTSTTANKDGYSIPVPGLADNPKLRIRRGRFTIEPWEVNGIFEPVIKRVIELVKGQIQSSNKKIKMVLLVGGFGENTYLKECMRGAFPHVKVLQPANAWAAITRGALMMGLSRANPSSARVKMTSRTERKSYGTQLNYKFDAKIHDASKKFWSSKDEYYQVEVLVWFVRKGDSVEEDKPQKVDFVVDLLVSEGLPKVHKMEIYVDGRSMVAPIHPGPTVKRLVFLKADFRYLSTKDLALNIVKRADCQEYYCIEGCIEATFYSASTKYALLYRGVRYDTVTTDYV